GDNAHRSLATRRPTAVGSGVPQSATEAPLSRGFLSRALTENRCPRVGTCHDWGGAPLLIPSLFSVRGPGQRARGRREGLQATSRQRSRRASSYGVLPRSDPQGRDTYTAWTLKQPSWLHLGSRTYPTWCCTRNRAVAITVASFIYSGECGVALRSALAITLPSLIC